MTYDGICDNAMIPEELAQIQERAEAATSGYWQVSEAAERTIVVSPTEMSIDILDSDREYADATFIAHARTDVPALCNSLEEAWREREYERDALVEQVFGVEALTAERDQLRKQLDYASGKLEAVMNKLEEESMGKHQLREQLDRLIEEYEFTMAGIVRTMGGDVFVPSKYLRVVRVTDELITEDGPAKDGVRFRVVPIVREIKGT